MATRGAQTVPPARAPIPTRHLQFAFYYHHTLLTAYHCYT